MLKGLCVEDIEGKAYDTHYYIHGLERFKQTFQGAQSSHIFLDDQDQWRLQSYFEPLKFAFIPKEKSDDRYPIGRKIWKIQKGICGIEHGEKQLTLSACGTDEFTCNYGKCIDLHKKCDLSNDCKDGLDEAYCDNIEIPNGYRRSLAPRRATGMYINVSISSFPLISTELLKFPVNFELSLRWHDTKLTYINLRNISNLNKFNMVFVQTCQLVMPNRDMT